MFVADTCFKTSDVLGKLTVLGTIVLPMNIVTGELMSDGHAFANP